MPQNGGLRKYQWTAIPLSLHLFALQKDAFGVAPARARIFLKTKKLTFYVFFPIISL